MTKQAEDAMAVAKFDFDDVKRRMQQAVQMEPHWRSGLDSLCLDVQQCAFP